MRPSEAILAPAGSRSFFCSSSIKTLFLVLWLSLWTSQLTCCALSLMPTLFWHTSPSIHERWFCFWKRKVNTKSMLTRAYFMETIAHLGIAFLKTEKEKKNNVSDLMPRMLCLRAGLSFLSCQEGKTDMNVWHWTKDTMASLCCRQQPLCGSVVRMLSVVWTGSDRGWGGPQFPEKQLRSRRREGFVSGTWNDASLGHLRRRALPKPEASNGKPKPKGVASWK